MKVKFPLQIITLNWESNVVPQMVINLALNPFGKWIFAFFKMEKWKRKYSNIHSKDTLSKLYIVNECNLLCISVKVQPYVLTVKVKFPLQIITLNWESNVVPQMVINLALNPFGKWIFAFFKMEKWKRKYSNIHSKDTLSKLYIVNECNLLCISVKVQPYVLTVKVKFPLQIII